jgi:hypothetical protein
VKPRHGLGPRRIGHPAAKDLPGHRIQPVQTGVDRILADTATAGGGDQDDGEVQQRCTGQPARAQPKELGEFLIVG